jgi:hypothetical protein
MRVGLGFAALIFLSPVSASGLSAEQSAACHIACQCRVPGTGYRAPGNGYQVPDVPPAVPKPDTSAPRADTLPVAVDSLLKPSVDTIAKPTVDSTASLIWLIDDSPLVRARLAEIRGTGPRISVLRSTSSLLWSGQNLPDGVRPLAPQFQFVRNSAIPFSRNDGALWAGHGNNTRLMGGVAAKVGVIRFVLAPELTSSQNDTLPTRNEGIIPSPPIPPDRSKFSYPWYANGPYSLDLPLRFGSKPLHRLRPGQSSILADLGRLTFGFSTENEWWGPGIDNALILSNNAPGFPHLLLRSSRPLGTRLGEFDFRWLVGGLAESPFFDTTSTNNTRSIASAVVVLRPRGARNLTLGMAHNVIGTSTGWGKIPFRWLDVMRNTGHPNAGAPYDSTLSPGGRDQMYSFFARFVMPASGAEIYGEWGRLDFPTGLRDLLIQPNRGQAYTLGLQWTRQAFTPTGIFHLRLENTSLEQSLALRNRFAGVWYTSRRVLQGFTNEGEVLGAAVGPGSSGQIAEANYFSKQGFFGLEFGRSRYNEDVHQASPMLEYLRWCSHDIGLQWGVHGGFSSRFGTFSVRSLYQDRLNAYFQSGHGCPRSEAMVDIRNRNLTLTFSPFAK